jgi:hypothetical protein
MNIVVHSKSKGKQALVEATAKLYKQELRLGNSTYTVEIQFKKGLANALGIKGNVCEIAPKHILMLLDSNLKDDRLFETLAHEMIHVKQYAKGQYKAVRTKRFWMGQHIKANYYDQPWEQEAMAKEKLLAGKIYAIIAQAK